MDPTNQRMDSIHMKDVQDFKISLKSYTSLKRKVQTCLVWNRVPTFLFKLILKSCTSFIWTQTQ